MALMAGEYPLACEPKPSTVVMASPSHAHNNRRHALMARGSPSAPTAMTVQAPHPPSPQPTLVPVSPCARSQSESTSEGDGFSSVKTCPLTLSMSWETSATGTGGGARRASTRGAATM
eukprot:scaffold174744_cov28-Tisochrysis_lutea.AAC.6